MSPPQQERRWRTTATTTTTTTTPTYFSTYYYLTRAEMAEVARAEGCAYLLNFVKERLGDPPVSEVFKHTEEDFGAGLSHERGWLLLGRGGLIDPEQVPTISSGDNDDDLTQLAQATRVQRSPGWKNNIE